MTENVNNASPDFTKKQKKDRESPSALLLRQTNNVFHDAAETKRARRFLSSKSNVTN